MNIGEDEALRCLSQISEREKNLAGAESRCMGRKLSPPAASQEVLLISIGTPRIGCGSTKKAQDADGTSWRDAFLHRVCKLPSSQKMFRTTQWGRIWRWIRNDWSKCQPSLHWKVLKGAGHITFLFDRCPDRAERRVPDDRQETSRPFRRAWRVG
jgi:hypothetical protein